MQKFVLLFVLLVVAYVSAESEAEKCMKLGNQTWAPCGKPCEPDCEAPGFSRFETCPLFLTKEDCPPSCGCAQYYNRNKEGKCVLAEDC